MSTVTENGAISHASTGSAVLNYFFRVVRKTETSQLEALLKAAWDENPLLTLRAVFHLRDCRGGKGERSVFHDSVRWLIRRGHARHVLHNLEHIPFYGTYKDLLVACAGTELESHALALYAKTLNDDLRNISNLADGVSEHPPIHPPITLAAKWAPTEGGELDKKFKLARKLVSAMRSAGVTNFKDYRTKVLTPLRRHLDVVERRMCALDWDSIDYTHVPSVAMKNYRKAFAKHSDERFAKYLADVKTGAAKINAAAVFPHQLVKHYLRGGGYDECIEMQWKAIVEAAKEKFGGSSAIPLIDTSSSMTWEGGEPQEVAIALGLLLSEISVPAFRGKILTFTSTPSLFTIDLTETLQQKVRRIQTAPSSMSTNLAAAFDLILEVATRDDTHPKDMPKTLYIFSDMQFDVACPGKSQTNFQTIEDKYQSANYTRPLLVFWNLRATLDFPVEQHVPRTALVSGFSQSLMELFCSGTIVSPYAVMLQALNAQRYSKITLFD